jgi:hypothetical protein
LWRQSKHGGAAKPNRTDAAEVGSCSRSCSRNCSCCSFHLRLGIELLLLSPSWLVVNLKLCAWRCHELQQCQERCSTAGTMTNQPQAIALPPERLQRHAESEQRAASTASS